ncbi:apolipoprotein N-acyltransferase [Kaarinaea lacus]
MKIELFRSISDWRGDLAALILGGLVPLAFAPFDLFPVVFLSIAALFYIVENTADLRRVFLRGYLFGVGYFGLGVSWVAISMVRFGGMSLPLSIALTALLVLFLALYIAGVGYLGRKFFSRLSSRLRLLLVYPSLWVLLEWVRGWLFTGFPWIDVGYSQVLSPLAGLFPLLGVYGVTFVVAICAACLVLLLYEQGKTLANVGLLLVSLLAVSGLLMFVTWSSPVGQAVKVSLIQGNVPQEMKWIPSQRQPTIDLYTGLTRQHWDSDIIIWPETALPAYYHQAEEFLRRLASEAHANQSSMLIGLPFLDFNNGERRYFNSAVVLDNGDIQFYHKYHLVPFGEYVPLKWLLGDFLDFLRIPMANFSHSDKHEPVVTMSGLKGAVSICYEDAFGEEVIDGLPEANFLINISNDAWFGDSLAPHQHLQKARVRALETARPMLRATNNGISAVIDHEGNILKTSPQFKEDVLTAEFQPMQGSTLYVMLGNYPVLLFSVLLLLLAWRWKRAVSAD